MSEQKAVTSSPKATSPVVPRLWGLEILRFSSALAILILHYPAQYLSPFPELEGRALVLPFWLETLLSPFRFGSWAVQVFWILSGYIFYHQYSRRVSEGEVSARKFFIHRFSRLYPLHLFTLLSVVALQFLYNFRSFTGPFGNNSWQNFLLHLGFASNWWVFEKSFNKPVWSVSVEVLVYGLFYLLLRRFPRAVWPSLALLVPSLFLNQHKSFEGGVIECILFFFAGGLTWLLQERTPERFRMGVAMSMVVAVLGCWAAGCMHAPKTLLLLGVTPGVVCLAHLPAWNDLAKICNQLGHLTYSSYLLHFPISLLLVWFFGELGLDPAFFLNPGSFIFILVGILALSGLSYRYLEEPCQSWIRRKSILPNHSFAKVK